MGVKLNILFFSLFIILIILTSGCETYIGSEREPLLSPITCKTYEGTDALCVGAPIGSDNFDQYCPDGYYYHYRKSCYSKKGPIEAVSELPPPRFGPGGNTVNICCMPTVCNDGLDNDGDGDCDLPDSTCDGPFTPGDSGCFDLDDTSETVDCGNGLDDDLDGYCDTIDGECIDGSIPGDESCMDRHGEWNEDIGSEGTACGDWKDNDNDGYCDTTEIITTTPPDEENECLYLKRGDPGCQIEYYNHIIDFMPKVREKSDIYPCDDGKDNHDADGKIDYVLDDEGINIGDQDCQSPFDQFEGNGTWIDDYGVDHNDCVDPEELTAGGVFTIEDITLCPNEIFDWSEMYESYGISIGYLPGFPRVTIDCQGSKIIGPELSEDLLRQDTAAITGSNRRVTVKNCHFVGFDAAIVNSGGIEWVIENNKFEKNKIGIEMFGQYNYNTPLADIYNNDFVDNEIYGLYIEEYKTNVPGVINSIYHNNFINNAIAIGLLGGDVDKVRNNHIYDNYIMGNDLGLFLRDAQENVIERNNLLGFGGQSAIDCDSTANGNVGINFCELSQINPACSNVACQFSEFETPDTLLLLRFDNNLNGAGGETPRAGYGITDFAAYSGGGVGVRINDGDLLSYDHNNNLDIEEGTLEFIFVPSWNGDDGIHRTFFQDYSGDIGLRLGKFFGSVPIPVDKDYLYFKLQHGGGEYAFWEANTFFNDIVYGTNTVVVNWTPNVPYHVKVTWSKEEEFLKFYVDGELVSEIDDWN